MKTDVDTALKDIADWYIKNRRGITEPELEAILLKHCEDEAEVQKFVRFLETEPGQLRFKTLLREERMPRINPHATAIQQDKQLVEQMKWLKAHSFKTARAAQEAGY